MSQGLFYCMLLAFQFGLQPKIAKVFQNENINKSSIVIVTELTKIFIAAITLPLESDKEKRNIVENWNIRNSITIAALPAILYAIQNLTTQYAYQLIDPMTFNLLNQTKTLAAAFWLYIIMGQKQTYIQVFALILLLVAAFILTSKDINNFEDIFSMININSESIDIKIFSDLASLGNTGLGILLVILASMISGISTALTQKTLQIAAKGKGRNSIFLSAEMAVYAIPFLIISDKLNSNKNSIKLGSDNFFAHWNILTFIPVLCNAFGGIIVGLVTKYAGGVKKGFALIAGLLITAFASWIIDKKKLRVNDWLALIIVAISIYLHSAKFDEKKEKVA